MAGEKLVQKALQAVMEARAAKHVADPAERAANLAKWQTGTPTQITDPTWYHGTERGFDTFRSDRPAFVTQNPDFANQFSTKNLVMSEFDPVKGTWPRFHEGSTPNIMPVHVRAQNPFDYENKAHIKALRKELEPDFVHDPELKNFVGQASMGNWGAIESSPIQNALKALGHDSFYVLEEGNKNLAVYDPNRQFKSATGNTGRFDPEIPRIDENRGGEVEREHHAEGKLVGSVERDLTPAMDQNVIRAVELARSFALPSDVGVSGGGNAKREEATGEFKSAFVSPGVNAGPLSAGAIIGGVRGMDVPMTGYRVGSELPAGFSVDYSSVRPAGTPASANYNTLSLARDILGTNVSGSLSQQEGKHGYGLSLSRGNPHGEVSLSAMRPPTGGFAVMGGLNKRFAEGGEVREHFDEGGFLSKIFGGEDYQSNSRPLIEDGVINWGDPESKADYFRAAAALQRMENERKAAEAPPVPLPPPRPASLDAAPARREEPSEPAKREETVEAPKPPQDFSLGAGYRFVPNSPDQGSAAMRPELEPVFQHNMPLIGKLEGMMPPMDLFTGNAPAPVMGGDLSPFAPPTMPPTAPAQPEVKETAPQAIAKAAPTVAPVAPTPPSEVRSYAPTPASGPGANPLLAAIRGAESRNIQTAQNPKSSAGGLYQFLDTTWGNTLRRMSPEHFGKFTDAQLKALKTHPEMTDLQHIAANYHLKNDIEPTLKRAGIPLTPGTAYLSWFQGPAGAVRAFTAPQNATVAQVFPNTVGPNANMRFNGKPYAQWTMADLRAWADSTMASRMRREDGGEVVEREAHGGGSRVVDKALEALRGNSRLTQIATTGPSYEKGLAHLAREGIEGKAIDYGAGRGHGLRSIKADTFEPYPQGWKPTYTDPNAIPDEAYRRLLNLNVLNVLDPAARDEAVANMGRIIQPGGGGIISTRGRDVMAAKGVAGPEPMSLIIGEGDAARYQKGFTPKELREYVGDTLGPRFDVEPSDVGAASILFRRNREDGGEVVREHHAGGELVGKALAKYFAKLSTHTDAPTKRIADWQWRPLPEVAKELNMTEVPPHVQDFGKYMVDMSNKAANEGLSARDLIKGYTTTRASIQRRATDADRLRALGLNLPSDVTTIRPEGAWAEWLMTPMGKRYLDAAAKGNVEGDAVANAIKIMSPFGRHETDIPDAMKWAAQNLPGREQAASNLVARAAQGASSPEEWRAFTSDIRGVGPSKSGFLASLYGRGDQPTLDARQIILNTGAPTKDASRYIARGGGEGGVEAVDRLAARQRALDLDLPSEYDPFYQHLAHHAIWDKASNEMTTHGDVIRAMREAHGGAVDHALRIAREHHADGEAVGQSDEAKKAIDLANRIRAYEATVREVNAQPEQYRQMTHLPAPPTAPIEIEGGYIGKRQLGEAPYNVAGPLSGLAQTAYGLKTAPLYAIGSVFPPAAAAATALDTGEAAIDAAKNIREGNYGSAALDVGLGVLPGAAVARKPIAEASRRALNIAREYAPQIAGGTALAGATLAPSDAEAAKVPRIKASDIIPRTLTAKEIREAYGPHTLQNVSPEDLPRLIDAYSKIATPHSPGNLLPQFGMQTAEAYRPKIGFDTSSGSYFNVKPSVPKEATTTVETPFHGPTPKTPVKETWDDIINRYYGSPMVSIGGDRSDLKTLYGINSDALARPTKIHAGFKYMLEPNPNEIWGNAAAHSGAYEALYDKLKKAMKHDLPVIGAATPMGPQAIDSSRDFTNLLLSGMEGRGIHPSDLKAFSQHLTSGEFFPNAAKREAAARTMEGFPGFENFDLARQFLLDPKIPGTVRREFAQSMDKAAWRDRGFPEVGSYRLGSTDEYLRDVPANMIGGRLVEIDPKLFADAKQKKVFEHFTYPSSTYGKYIADVPFVQRHYAMPDAIEDLMLKYNQVRPPVKKGGADRPPLIVHPFSTETTGTSTARKMFEEQKQVQELNDRMRQAIQFGEARRGDYGYKDGGSVEDRALEVTWKCGSK